MSERLRLLAPAGCAQEDLELFERLVREGFDGSDTTLPERIRNARFLAFHRGDSGKVEAIAGLKVPDPEYRDHLFEASGAAVGPDGYNLELGWVYVVPAGQRRGIGLALCREVLRRATGRPIFATTRPGNVPMITILEALGFRRSGGTIPRRGEELALFLKPVTSSSSLTGRGRPD